MAGVSVEKRGKTWRYRFDMAPIGGQRQRHSKGGFATKRDALAAGNAALAEYNGSGFVFKPSEVSYSDFLDHWLGTYCEVNLKPGTINEYRYNIDHYIRPHIGKYLLNQITPSLLQKLINDLFQQGYSRNHLLAIKALLTSTFNYAVEPSKFIKESPAVYIKLPLYRAKSKVPTRANPHIYITREEFDQIIARFPEKSSSHIPLLLGYRCGLRKGEIYGLSVTDIDFENKTLSINRQLQRDNKRKQWYMTAPKYESYRVIDLDDELIEVLKRRIENINKMKIMLGVQFPHYYLDDHGYLVDKPTDKEFFPLIIKARGQIAYSTSVVHVIETVQKNLKIKGFDFHSLRHTHATMLVEAGAPLKWIQKRLGHKSITVTLGTYQHVSETITDQGICTLNSMFANNSAEETA